MMTALPPALTTSYAVWRPIPLLPPTTTSFKPAKCFGAPWSRLVVTSSFSAFTAFIVSLMPFVRSLTVLFCAVHGK
jgi:hypothetical protein